MKALLLNAMLGTGRGRFGAGWRRLVFLPLVAAELAYGVYVYNLGPNVSFVRRGLALLACGQLGYLLGALLRPIRSET